MVKEVMRLSDGYGCDVYIEATGHPNSVVQVPPIHTLNHVNNSECVSSRQSVPGLLLVG